MLVINSDCRSFKPVKDPGAPPPGLQMNQKMFDWQKLICTLVLKHNTTTLFYSNFEVVTKS